MTWYLKKEGEEVFGPVDLALLKSWATTGRVAPDDQISEDQEHWITAADLDDLQMDWVLKFEDGGEYGPLHAMTISQMVENGELDPTLAVAHRETKEQQTAWAISLVVLGKLNRQLKESSDALAQRLSLAEASHADSNKVSRGAPQAVPTSITDAYHNLSRDYEWLMNELSEKSDEIQILMKSRAEAERHAEQSIQEMSQRLQREQEAADAVRERFREMEESHLQLVKAYREMNDRYIQLRHSLGAAPEAKPVSGSDEAQAGPKANKKSEWKPKIPLIR